MLGVLGCGVTFVGRLAFCLAVKFSDSCCFCVLSSWVVEMGVVACFLR